MTWLEMAPVGDAWSVPRTRVRRLDKLYQFTLNLVSLDDRAYQQLAELLLLVEKRRSDRVGFMFWVLKPFLVRITRFRLSKGVTALLSPLSFRGSSILPTIRNIPPLAFGIHNEQYGCDMIII